MEWKIIKISSILMFVSFFREEGKRFSDKVDFIFGSNFLGGGFRGMGKLL